MVTMLSDKNKASASMLPTLAEGGTRLLLPQTGTDMVKSPIMVCEAAVEVKYCHTLSGVVCNLRKIPCFLSSGNTFTGPKNAQTYNGEA